MTNDVFESISQGSSRTEDAENCRIQEIANELHRRSCLYEEELRESKNNVRPSEIECRVAEGYAKEKGLWLPIAQVFGLGVPGPCGNENDTYVSDDIIFKVNNLLNSRGSVVQYFQKIFLHNTLFSETAYSFYVFTGFPGGTIMPIFKQNLIKEATPATTIEIATYMAALGFRSTSLAGRYTNDKFEVWDLLPRNVLKDDEGDIFVVDAEIKLVE